MLVAILIATLSKTKSRKIVDVIRLKGCILILLKAYKLRKEKMNHDLNN